MEKTVAYYTDPRIEWFDCGTPFNGGPASGAGYYIVHFCQDVDCCRPVGPFSRAEEARNWSRQHLALSIYSGFVE